MTDILMRPVVRLQLKLAELREREDGQTTTEYAILLGFLAIAIIVALFFLRDVLRELFSEAARSVENAPGGRKRASAGRLMRRPLQKVCAGPVTPSTGPAHTFCVKGVLRPTTAPFRKRRDGCTMRRRSVTSSRRPRGRRQSSCISPSFR